MASFGGDGFDHFKRGKKIRQFETDVRTRLQSTNDEILKKIATEEAEGELERRVVDEMREFFRFSTRLAAQVLAEIQQRRADEIEVKLDAEIEGFFEETKERAMRVLADIKNGDPQARQQLTSVLRQPVRQVTHAAFAATHPQE
jgi:hypothetical protein